MGRLDTAVENSRRILETEPENHLAHTALGMSLKLLGRLTDAETSYRQALAFNPDCFEAKINLASVLQLMGRNQEAIRLLFDLADSEPTNLQVRRNLAERSTVLRSLGLERSNEKSSWTFAWTMASPYHFSTLLSPQR